MSGESPVTFARYNTGCPDKFGFQKNNTFFFSTKMSQILHEDIFILKIMICLKFKFNWVSCIFIYQM